MNCTEDEPCVLSDMCLACEVHMVYDMCLVCEVYRACGGFMSHRVYMSCECPWCVSGMQVMHSAWPGK